MTVLLGRWRSPGGTRIRESWERARSRALDIISPVVAQQTNSVFGPPEPPQLRPTAGPSIFDRQRAASMAALTQARRPAPALLGAGARGTAPQALRPTATVAPRGAQGPFPFQGGRNIMDLLSAAGSAIGNLPLPGGPITAVPSARGGRPGATISGVRPQTVGDVNRFESMIAERTTEPVGRFLGENITRGVIPPGVPGRERAVGIGGEVGATVLGEGARVSNLIPIPVIDPLIARGVANAARLAKVALGPGARVTRTEASRVVDALGRAIAGEPDEAVRGALAQFRRTLQSERGSVPLGPGGGKPVPENLRVSASDRGVTDIPVNQIDVRPELFQARDISVGGEGIGAKRVRELIENFDPARLDPIHVLRDPENPGRFIVRDGHHRTAAVRGKFGADATIPAIIVEGDIRDAAFLSKMRLEAVASNFSVAEMNVREQVRSVRALTESGLSLDDAASQLRMKPSETRDLADIDLLGVQVLDRIVAEPAVIPIAAEVGRAMRLFGVDAEQAGALFARFSQVDDAGRVVTRTSLRRTLAKFAPKLEGVTLPGFDSALGGADTRSGILELIADVGRSRAQLESERGALRAAIKATTRLGESSGLKSEADALVRFGEKAVDQVEARIKTLERDLTQQLTREAATPSGITTERAVSETPLFGAETPPTARPTGAVTFGEERIAPQFGSQRPEFRGEQAGIAPRLLDDAETGFQGQGRLEDVARPAAEQPPAGVPPRRPPPTGGPPPPPEPPGQPRGAFERGERPRVEGQPVLPGELAPEGVTGVPPRAGQRPRVEGQRPLPGQLAPAGVTGEPVPAGGSVSQADLDPLAALRRDLEATYLGDAELGDAPTVFHRDVIGERLLRDNLPTSADVRSWSASTPPEVRAARAEEILDVRGGVEDFDVVVGREADRYRENFVTKFDDWWQPVRGRDREKQKIVRDAFLDGDVFVARMSNRQRIALQLWTAEHHEVLGLTTSNLDPITRKVLRQGQRGRALKIQPRPGRKIHPEALQRLDDIVEHSGDYIIAPEQQRALDDLEALMTDNLRAVQRNGGDVNFLENYAPHVITRTPPGMTREVALANLSTRFPVTHPWFTKARTVPDVRQLLELGYGVADPLAAAELRLVAGIQTIANVQIVKRLRRLGVSSAEQVPTALAANLRAATKLQQSARKQALRTGTTADRATAHKADVALDKATREMRLAARRIDEQRPKRFGRDVPPDVAVEMDKFMGAEDQGFVDDALRVMRTSVVGADLGSAYLQNATTFWRDLPAWATGMGVGLRAIASTPYDYLLRNTDSLLFNAQYGALIFPEEFILARGGRFPQLLGKAPIVQESQTFLEWNIMITQNEVAKGVMKLATSEKELLDLAVVLRNRSGASFTPGLTASQARWMRKLLFAKSFTTAITSAVLDPFIRTGVARREAMKGMGAIFGGAAALVVAGTMVKNGSPGNFTDPDKPGFWGVPVPGGFVFPLGPFQPLVVASTRTARAAADIARGRKPSDRDAKAWPRFITNKASIAVRWATRAAEALGLPIENLVGPSFGRPEVIREGETALSALRRELTNIAPIGPRQAVEGIRGGNFPTGALEIGGVRTTPDSPFSLRFLAREDVLREMRQRGVEIVVPGGFDKQNAIVQAQIDRDPRVQEADAKLSDQPARDRRGEGFDFLDTLRERTDTAQLEDDAEFDDGVMDGGRWRQRHSDRERDFFSQREVTQEIFGITFKDKEATNRIDTAIAAYFAVELEDFTDEGGESDWRGFRKAQQDALSPLSEGEQQSFRAQVIGKNDTPVEQRFRVARQRRDELGEISPVRGLGIDQWEELQDFWREVRDFQNSRSDEGKDRGSFEAAIRFLAREQNKSEGFTEVAVLLRSGTRARETMRNRDYDLFLLRNYDVLSPFYQDDLYGSVRMREMIAQAKQTGLIGASPQAARQPQLVTP